MTRELPSWMVGLRSNGIQSTPLLTFDGQFHCIKDPIKCGEVCQSILESLHSYDKLAMGFDMEWPVSFIRGAIPKRTSLIQLSPSLEVCYLFQVAEWLELPKEFLTLIQHPKILLVGLNITCDLWKLARDFDISVTSVIENNTLDLGVHANRVYGCQQQWSLARLVEYTIKKRLDKDNSIRIGNWDRLELSPRQIEYAALDVYATLLVYEQLKCIKNNV